MQGRAAGAHVNSKTPDHIKHSEVLYFKYTHALRYIWRYWCFANMDVGMPNKSLHQMLSEELTQHSTLHQVCIDTIYQVS